MLYFVSCFILLLDGGGRIVSFGLYVLIVIVDRNMQSRWASLYSHNLKKRSCNDWQ